MRKTLLKTGQFHAGQSVPALAHERVHADSDGLFTCLCGNTPEQAGFYPCSTEGEQVEMGTSDWYVCDQCGRIINSNNRHVVGCRFNNTLTLEEKQVIFADRKQREDAVNAKHLDTLNGLF